MPTCKGTFFVALREFLKKRCGATGTDRYLAALTPADRQVVETTVSISDVDIQLRVRAVRALQEVFGSEQPEIVFQFGMFEAERDLTTTQRFFLRLANPAFVLEKAGDYWRRYYDWGQFVVTRQGETAAKAVLENGVVADELFCRQIMGYIHRLLEMVGAKDVEILHPKCRSRGDSDCEYDGRWREK